MQETQETWIQFLGWEDPLGPEMAAHSSILGWKNLMDRGAWRAIVQGVSKRWMTDTFGYSLLQGIFLTQVSCIAVRFFIIWANQRSPIIWLVYPKPAWALESSEVFIILLQTSWPHHRSVASGSQVGRLGTWLWRSSMLGDRWPEAVSQVAAVDLDPRDANMYSSKTIVGITIAII